MEAQILTWGPNLVFKAVRGKVFYMGIPMSIGPKLQGGKVFYMGIPMSIGPKSCTILGFLHGDSHVNGQNTVLRFLHGDSHVDWTHATKNHELVAPLKRDYRF